MRRSSAVLALAVLARRAVRLHGRRCGHRRTSHHHHGAVDDRRHAAATATTGTRSPTRRRPTLDSATTPHGASPARSRGPTTCSCPPATTPPHPMPLVILLHGFGSSGAVQEAYFQLQPLAEARGFLYVHPDGTDDIRRRPVLERDRRVLRLRAAMSTTSATSLSLIEQVEADYNVDPKRVYFDRATRNGGFMSYRMACEAADTRRRDRQPRRRDLRRRGAVRPVAAGQRAPGPRHRRRHHRLRRRQRSSAQAYPGAPASVGTWADYDGCALQPTSGRQRSTWIAGIAGAETSTSAFDRLPHGRRRRAVDHRWRALTSRHARRRWPPA